VVNYAGDDAKLCWHIWHKFGHLFPERERRLSRMTTDQAIKGLFVDKPALERDVEMLKKVKEVARQHLPWAPKIQRTKRDSQHSETPRSLPGDRRHPA
jgi:hypothetical protein